MALCVCVVGVLGAQIRLAGVVRTGRGGADQRRPTTGAVGTGRRPVVRTGAHVLCVCARCGDGCCCCRCCFVLTFVVCNCAFSCSQSVAVQIIESFLAAHRPQLAALRNVSRVNIPTLEAAPGTVSLVRYTLSFPSPPPPTYSHDLSFVVLIVVICVSLCHCRRPIFSIVVSQSRRRRRRTRCCMCAASSAPSRRSRCCSLWTT